MSLSDVDAARADATRSSGGGVAFLLAYAATLLVAGLLHLRPAASDRGIGGPVSGWRGAADGLRPRTAPRLFTR